MGIAIALVMEAGERQSANFHCDRTYYGSRRRLLCVRTAPCHASEWYAALATSAADAPPARWSGAGGSSGGCWGGWFRVADF